MRLGSSNRAYMLCSIAVALALCFSQIRGSLLLIGACLVAVTAMMCFAAIGNKTLPLLLFFIPWSPIMRTSPDTFSFFTVNLVLVCGLGLIKKWRHFKRYHIVAGILLMFLTLVAKLVDGSGLAMDYICFMMLILLLPVVAYEMRTERYDFTDAVVYFSTGIILASLCAQMFAGAPNLAKYIRVDSYLTITRRCGFYGDPNFFVAQVTAALSGCLVLLLKKKSGPRRVLVGALTMLLLYCGFLSGSKSFALVVGAMLLVWMAQVMFMRGQSVLKITLIVCAVAATVYISTSVLFKGLIDVIMVRFASATNLDTFTTGRPELWISYIKEIMNDVKVLLIGQGFTNIKVNARASHNTLIQLIFQFGCLGAPVLLGWCWCFFREHFAVERYFGVEKLKVLILMIGIFAPWLAIDSLFFDEFFLWQWFFVMGMQMLAQDKANSALEQEEEAQLCADAD